MNSLVSVIVPVYNVEKYLDKCIKSILNQKYRNIEIILVDDGSTDSSGSICDSYAKKDDRIKVIHKKNGGLSSARNTGIDEAKGEYIGFVDSDDYIDEDMYETMVKKLIDNNSDIVICSKVIEYSNGKILKNNYKEKLIKDNIEGLKQLNSYKVFDMSACDKLYKISLFKNIRFPFGKKCEDYYTMFKLISKCKKILYIPNCYYHYFQRENSISRNVIIDESYIDASKSQIEFFMKNYPNLLYVAYSSYAFANIVIFNKYIKNGLNCPKEKILLYKNEVKKNIKYILKNKLIIIKKKLQAIVFSINPKIYKKMFQLLKN